MADGKRTKVAQFMPHARGGVGIRSAVVNKKDRPFSKCNYAFGIIKDQPRDDNHNFLKARPPF